jgi:predicted metal-dependent hydrolase
LAAALTSEQGQLQAIAQREPGWMAGKKAHAKWEEQVARQKTRIAQIALRLDKVGEIEEAAGVYTQMKIEELAERKLRFDKPELAQEWDRIQHRERQAAISDIESTQSLGQDLGRSLTLSRTADEE